MWLCGWPGIAPNGAAPTASYCSKTPSQIFNNANQIIGRSYDGAGNMASLMGSDFTYDAENRITSAVQPGMTEREHGLQLRPDTWFTVFGSRR
jgi:uncharacterized protein with beta-barrel porin domain